MNRRNPTYAQPEYEDVDSLRGHYLAIRDWLLAQSDRDIQYNLPNLVETLVEASTDPETVRFVVGVSFTQNHTPLDYRLDRVFDPPDVDFHRYESMKLPVSQHHHYVQFLYPPDPRFDANALRASLLSAIETALHRIDEEADDNVSTGSLLSDLWFDL